MKDITKVRMTTEVEWRNYATMTNKDDALRTAQTAHKVEGFPAVYVQEVSSQHFDIMVLEDRPLEKTKMSSSFKKILDTSAASKPQQSSNYCQSCYRRNLKPEQIAYMTHGECYCTICSGGSNGTKH